MKISKSKRPPELSRSIVVAGQTWSWKCGRRIVTIRSPDRAKTYRIWAADLLGIDSEEIRHAAVRPSDVRGFIERLDTPDPDRYALAILKGAVEGRDGASHFGDPPGFCYADWYARTIEYGWITRADDRDLPTARGWWIYAKCNLRSLPSKIVGCWDWSQIPAPPQART